MKLIQVVCEAPELAVECRRTDGHIPIIVAPAVSGAVAARPAWFEPTRDALHGGGLVGLCLLASPAASELIELSDIASGSGGRLVVCALQAHTRRCVELEAATDLGVVVTEDTEGMLCALILLSAGFDRPWAASAKGLSLTDRLRMDGVLGPTAKRTGYLTSGEDGRCEFRAKRSDPPLVQCGVRGMIDALQALKNSEAAPQRVSNTVDDVEDRTVVDVLFGPRRALSDPASKAALSPYGLPMPIEELCTSPSRAAAEAARIGFPVRIALASPDLRIWDHPELAIDMLDSAARVRDAFRELQALAGPARKQGDDQRATARILGATVMATAPAVASFRVFAFPLPSGRVGTEFSFADAHGMAAGDRTLLFLPGAPAMVERAVRRLLGASLVLDADEPLRTAYLEALSDVLLRTAAFVNDRRVEIESVELRPVALLSDGTAEVREACVGVSDAFERNMDATLLSR